MNRTDRPSSKRPSWRLCLRALIAFLAMPGLVAFAIPAVWLRHTLSLRPAGPWSFLLIVLGAAALVWCIRDFLVSGRGTLAPWAPPEKLVTVGLYRYSRNPMYLSVTVILLGWAAAFSSRGMLIYALVFLVSIHGWVVFGEEPGLARTFGKQWKRYTRDVPRWFGRSTIERSR